VEADVNSGSITQAKFCIKQHRPLFAVVPHDDTNSLNLLCTGAKMLVEKFSALPLRTKDDYPFMLDRFAKQKSLMQSLDGLLV